MASTIGHLATAFPTPKHTLARHPLSPLPRPRNPRYGPAAVSSPPLDATDARRYARQMILPEIGTAGQRRLRNSSVLLIGAGGLGSPAALYLAAAGVGRIAIVDPDSVDESNLHRQILHGTSTVGQPKTTSAASRLRDLNPNTELLLHPLRFSPDNALALAKDHHLIIDGSDNFPTRFLTNDTGFFLGLPVVTGAIFRFDGQVTVLDPQHGGPCLRCFLPDLPPPAAVPSCAEAGVLGILPGIIGCLQASEALKILLATGAPLVGRMLRFDALAATFREIRLKPDPTCPLCGTNPAITSVDNPQTRATMNCPDTNPTPIQEIDAPTLAEKLARGFHGLLVDVREPAEHAQAAIPGSILVPLGTLADTCQSWPRDTEIIVHCKSGIRSTKALAILSHAGFPHTCHLAGGIEAWLNLPPH